MKIWYQSASPYRYESVFDAYGKALEEQCRRVVRADTHVHVEGTQVMLRDIATQKYLPYFHKIQSLNTMLRAEQEGYDAFVIGCALDIGLEEGKSMLQIPVVGIGQAAYHFAMMLGNLFAVVTSTRGFFEICNEQTETYGLAAKHLRGPYIYPASPDEIAAALDDPLPLVEKFLAVAEKAVDDGASVIIPVPIFISSLFSKAGVTTIRNALVLDTVSIAVKTAEMLVDLKTIGIEPSRRIGVYAKPDPATRKAVFEKVRKVFKIENQDRHGLGKE